MKEIDKLLKEGIKLIKDENYKKAIICLEKALKIDPKNFEVLRNRGIALRNLKRYEELIENYNLLLKISPKHEKVLKNKYIFLLELKRYEEALACINEFLEIKPNEKILHFKAICYEELKDYDNALKWYDKSLIDDPKNTHILFLKGLLLFKLERYKEALNTYNTVLKIDPNDKDALESKNDCLLEIKNFRKIDKNFKENKNLGKDNKKVNQKKNKTKIYGHYIDDIKRCDIKFLEAIKKNINPLDLSTSLYVKNMLIPKGVEFEKKVLEKINWVKSEDTFENLIKNKVLIKKPLLELRDEDKIKTLFTSYFQDLDGEISDNASEIIEDLSKNYTFVGAPEMIIPLSQGYVPLDIKNHSKITLYDKLRITYYSIILKNMLSSNKKIPIGLILLNNKIEKVDTSLYEDQVLESLMDIYYTLRDRRASEPSLKSDCFSCSLFEGCKKKLYDNDDLSLVYQIGESNKKELIKKNIKSISQLADYNSDQLKSLVKLPSFFQSRVYDIVCNHAKSLRDCKMIVFGKDFLPKNKTEIYLDLEYNPTNNKKDVFCFGLAIKIGKKTIFKQFFEDEKGFDKFIKDLILKNKNLLFITYAGTSADLPFLQNEDYFYSIYQNHFDMYHYISKNISLPLISYSEKTVAPFFGIDTENNSSINDGSECLFKYFDYLNEKNNKEKDKIKEEILQYNKSDLIGMIKLKEKLSEFMPENQFKNKPKSNFSSDMQLILSKIRIRPENKKIVIRSKDVKEINKFKEILNNKGYKCSNVYYEKGRNRYELGIYDKNSINRLLNEINLNGE